MNLNLELGTLSRLQDSINVDDLDRAFTLYSTP